MLKLRLLVTVTILSQAVPIFPVGTAWGIPAITCHCFQDREFDPATPAAADPYLLATLQNRLLGYRYGLPRQEIVRRKMSGTANDRLWVALQVARATGRSLETVLAEREAAASWREVAGRLGAGPEGLDAELMDGLANGTAEGVLAAAVIERSLREQFAVSADLLATLRKSGASDQELIAAVLLAGATGRSAPAVFQFARRNGSWGALMQQTGWSLARLDAWLARNPVVADR